MNAPIANVPIPKILAVDDNPNNLIALEAALGGMNLELVCVFSGKEALKQVEQNEFAAILLDVQMPVMDGFETAGLIRKNEKSSAVPIIFVTAIHRDQEFAEYAYNQGAVDFLFKPLNTGMLRAKIGVFCDLYRKTKMIERHAVQKREIELLKELLQSRDEFISIASHELKTPLSPLNLNLQLFADLLETGRVNEIPKEKLKGLLETASNQVGRLSRLVCALLDVSQIIENRYTIEKDWTDLAQIVREVCQIFEGEIGKAKVTLSLDLGADLVGRWDKAKLEQVVVNLLTNALKYGAGKPVQIRAFSTEREARLVVKDHGVGIDEKDQERIFNRFERATSSKHYGGLGLGLYIACRIVELHKGKIAVESSLGNGACFEVSLPKDQ